LKRPFKSGALARLYDGPFVIVAKLSDINYRIGAVDGSKLPFHDLVHVSRLKPFYGQEEEEEEEEEEELEEEVEEEVVEEEEVEAGNRTEEIENSRKDDFHDDVGGQAAVEHAVDRAAEQDRDLDERPRSPQVQPSDADETWPSPRGLTTGQIRQELQKQGIPFGKRSGHADLRLQYELAYNNRHDQEPDAILAVVKASKSKGGEWCRTKVARTPDQHGSRFPQPYDATSAWYDATSSWYDATSSWYDATSSWYDATTKSPRLTQISK